MWKLYAKTHVGKAFEGFWKNNVYFSWEFLNVGTINLPKVQTFSKQCNTVPLVSQKALVAWAVRAKKALRDLEYLATIFVVLALYPDWKKLRLLPERLSSPGTMWSKLKALLKPLNAKCCNVTVQGVSGRTLHWAPKSCREIPVSQSDKS